MFKTIGMGALLLATTLAVANPAAARDRDDFRFQENSRFARNAPAARDRARDFREDFREDEHRRHEQFERNDRERVFNNGYRNGSQNGCYDQFGNWRAY